MTDANVKLTRTDATATVEQSAQEAHVPGALTRARLVGFLEEQRTPLVLFDGQPGTTAVPAASVVDLHEAHVGRQVVLMFEQGNPARPVVMGVLRGEPAWPLDERPGQVEVVADGERLIVSAREQLVLECGKASITLTRAGKIIIHGTYVSSRSSGLMRIKGGSIQLN